MANWPVGTQLYVYMQTYGKLGKTVEDNLDEIFGQIAAAGLAGLEGFMGLVDGPEKIRKTSPLLEKHSLRLSSCYSGGAFHTRDDAEASLKTIVKNAQVAKAIGLPAINCNPSPIGRDKTDDELALQCAYLDKVGRELKGLGMEFHVHNHDPEIRNNAKEFRANFLRTNPEYVGLCVDTHWVYRGGMDPLALMKECPDRIKSLHIRNSVGGAWSQALGDGDVDYRPIKDFLEESGYRGWLLIELAIEQKTQITRPLAENLRLSREYVRKVFGS
jgi:inosose dehydratase